MPKIRYTYHAGSSGRASPATRYATTPIKIDVSSAPTTPPIAPEIVLFGLTVGQSFGPLTALPTHIANASAMQGMAIMSVIRVTCSAFGSMCVNEIALMPGRATVSIGSILSTASSSFGSERKMTQIIVIRQMAIMTGRIIFVPISSVSGIETIMPTHVGHATGRCPACASA